MQTDACMSVLTKVKPRFERMDTASREQRTGLIVGGDHGVVHDLEGDGAEELGWWVEAGQACRLLLIDGQRQSSQHLLHAWTLHVRSLGLSAFYSLGSPRLTLHLPRHNLFIVRVSVLGSCRRLIHSSVCLARERAVVQCSCTRPILLLPVGLIAVPGRQGSS